MLNSEVLLFTLVIKTNTHNDLKQEVRRIMIRYKFYSINLPVSLICVNNITPFRPHIEF